MDAAAFMAAFDAVMTELTGSSPGQSADAAHLGPDPARAGACSANCIDPGPDSMEPSRGWWGVTRMTREADTAGRDAEAFYVASYSRLVRVVALTCGSVPDAEEAVQEAFTRLLPRWRKVSGYDDPEAWVRTVAFRVLSNRFRRLQRERVRGQRERRSRAESEAVVPDDGSRVDLRRGLAVLPQAQRQVVVLHYLLDLPVQVVATELGVPVGTVKSRLARARTALAQSLSDEVNDGA